MSMSKEDRDAIAELINHRPPVSPIDPVKIFYMIGAGAVLAIGTFVWSTLMNHEEKIQDLSGAMQSLVILQETNIKEIARRGDWMDEMTDFRRGTQSNQEVMREKVQGIEQKIDEIHANIKE